MSSAQRQYFSLVRGEMDEIGASLDDDILKGFRNDRNRGMNDCEGRSDDEGLNDM